MQIFKHTMKSNSTMTLDEILEDSSNIHLLNSHITGRVMLNYSGCIGGDHSCKSDDAKDSFMAPVLAHIIYHDVYGYFLIDAGVDRSFIDDKYGSQKGLLKNEYATEIIQHQHQPIADYIEENDIKLSGIFLTHLHFDHVSGILDLDDNIPIYFSSLEKSMDLKPYYYGEYFKNKENIAILDINDFTPTKYGTFYDIFGDNSLLAIHTPGHTNGHLAYLINSDIKTIIAGDVFYIKDSLKYKKAPTDYMQNIAQAQITLEKIIQLYDDYKDKYEIKIIPGHDI